MEAKKFFASVLTVASAMGVIAQEAEVEATAVKESKVEFSFGADLVSSYVWRGQHLGSFAIQPSLDFSVAGFGINAWGSSGFRDGDTNELDFTISYGIKGFSIGVCDYFSTPSWNAKGYFDDNSHLLEGQIGYDFGEVCEKFKLYIAADVCFLNDFNEEGKEQYSSYMELGYPVESKYVNWDFAVGAALNKSSYYGVDRFGVINISVKATKDIKFSDKFTLPIFAVVALNPRQERVHWVVGLSF